MRYHKMVQNTCHYPECPEIYRWKKGRSFFCKPHTRFEGNMYFNQCKHFGEGGDEDCQGESLGKVEKWYYGIEGRLWGGLCIEHTCPSCGKGKNLEDKFCAKCAPRNFFLVALALEWDADCRVLEVVSHFWPKA